MSKPNEVVDWRSLLADQKMPTHDEEGNPLVFLSAGTHVPAGHVMDEFGQLWRIWYTNTWSSGKRQFTVGPAEEAPKS